MNFTHFSLLTSGEFSDIFSLPKLKNLEYVKEFYGYNNEKVKAALDILNDEQISAIKTRLNKGGRNGRS